MSYLHILGMAATIFVIVALSIYSSKTAKEKKGANSMLVSGAILGTLVGGSSTVGTAQLAYQFGLSAWWYTLGAGISCLVLSLVYAAPFHKSGNKTLAQFITKEYGEKYGVLASVFSSMGNFINIVAQLIAASAIVTLVFPEWSTAATILFSAVFMILYIIFGGTKGSGLVGILKMLLIYTAMVVAGALVLRLTGGLAGFFTMTDNLGEANKINYYSMFNRGVGKELGALLSIMFGVITTQTYAQAVFMADTTRQAKKGALISAIFTPPVGIGGILVGLYMRSAYPGIVPKTALTLFVTEHLAPLPAGIFLGALFIAAVGTGAGIANGISVNLSNDVLLPLTKKMKYTQNAMEKILLVILLGGASALSFGPLGDTILNFTFMSMALRGATIFLPLCCAIWLPGKIPPLYACISIIVSPTTVLLLNLWGKLSFDPLVIGILLSAIIMFVGYMKAKKKTLRCDKCS